MNSNENYLVIGAEPKKSSTFDKKSYIAITVLLVVLAVLLTFIITYACLDGALKSQYEEYMETVGEFKTIVELYNSLPEEMRNFEMYEKLAYIDAIYRTNYMGEIDEEKLVYALLNGYIVGAGDQFGAYYTADGFSDMMGETEGNTVGIGVYVSIDDTGYVKILYVMSNGPAYEAGLLPGDIITHIDGQSVLELGYYNAIDLVKGEKGTEVELTVLRKTETINVKVKRAEVTTESIIYSKHQEDETVGVIRIIDFNNGTPEQFINAIKELMNDGCKSLVFDLRNNPGGTLSSVVEMLDFLLPKGDVVSIRYSDGYVEKYKSDEKGEEFINLYGSDVKMAVLVNGNTASAAELFTCALKDYGVATVVGETTFGKGCGQNVLQLPHGDGLAITTFLYDPPKSPNYNGKGIEPDVKVELSEEAAEKNIFELAHSEDNQLSKALEAIK